MRIVIDMQGAQTGSRFRGIGRYTVALTKAIIRQRKEHEIILLLNALMPDTAQTTRQAFADDLPPGNILEWTAPGPVHASDPDNRGREALAQLLRESMIASLKPDLVCIASFFEGYADSAIASIRKLDQTTPVCAIAYDFIPLINPRQYLDHTPAYASHYRAKVSQMRHADLLLAISESSRSEAIEQLGMAPDRVVNIAAACDPCFRPWPADQAAPEELPPAWGITRPFILYTGGADERKNLPRLIEAFARLPQDIRQHHQLLFAGKLGPAQQAELLHVARRHGLRADELRFTGYVSDQELALAYSQCQLFVFPSWHEGFGLPPLEAMSCGAPAIAANTSSLPEVMGWDQALFDPFDVDAITRKILQVLTDPTFRDQLKAHALQQARRFSWDASAQQAINAMERLIRQTCVTPSSDGADTPAVSYEDWVAASAAVLHEHALLSEYDIASLAQSKARNESQLLQYRQAQPDMPASALRPRCENPHINPTELRTKP